VILDESNRVTLVNELCLEMLPIREARRLDDLPAAVVEDVRAVREAGGLKQRRMRLLEVANEEGGRRVLEYTVVPFSMTKVSEETTRDAAFICLTVRDVTDRELAHERIRFMALHDSLTGLNNRGALEQRLNEILDHRRVQKHLALVSFDLDRFKAVNDSLGHSIGDKVLIEVGRRATEVFGDDVALARVGGDEFSALLLDATAEQALELAKTLVEVISEPFWIQDHRISVGTSVGVVSIMPARETASTLMRQADVALYKAKHSSGRIAPARTRARARKCF
jgi:diguanylate cyclase (GGDEF)-like protein